MSKEISDVAAISFASAFYQALGYGKDVKIAFELGCGQIDLENLSEADSPKLLAIIGNPEQVVFVDAAQRSRIVLTEEKLTAIRDEVLELALNYANFGMKCRPDTKEPESWKMFLRICAF